MHKRVLCRRSAEGENADPSEDQIKAALTNMCRCGVYPRLVRAVQRAGRAMRGEDTIPPVPAPGIRPAEAARTVPALGSEQGDTK